MKTAPTKKKIIGLSVVVSAFLLVATGILAYTVLSGEEPATTAVWNSQNTQTATLVPSVLDANTKKPIEGATIVIPEVGKNYTTGPDGTASIPGLPIITDSHFSNILPKPWGEVTLLVYKDGYLPYALFSLALESGGTREGPEILLFPDTEGGNALSIIEGPNRIWVDALIEQYRPK